MSLFVPALTVEMDCNSALEALRSASRTGAREQNGLCQQICHFDQQTFSRYDNVDSQT